MSLKRATSLATLKSYILVIHIARQLLSMIVADLRELSCPLGDKVNQIQTLCILGQLKFSKEPIHAY
ncbi:hypothetical protein CEQ90_16960 [Lewinellaceae bacterium SD302]|nr:hypothetical protein CEQ90_16960 [Lewinellaceae bacterium SD302]